MYAMHEMSYEKCHEKADRICLVYLNGKLGSLNWIPVTCGPEGKGLKDMFPEIEQYSINRNTEAFVQLGDNVFREYLMLFTDSSFYSILTVPFIKGQPRFDPQSIALSEKTAVKYFGKTDPLGKLINVNCEGRKFAFTVTGVYKNFASNTEIAADFLAPLSLADRLGWDYNNYKGSNYQTLVLLKPRVDVKKLNVKIASAFKIPIPIIDIKAFLMPLKQVHMHGTYANNFGKLLSFLIGGFFVLITSCFNYVNLTNILYTTRVKEIGIRKVNGANKHNLFIQFLSDNALTTLIAFNLAIVILIVSLPWFNTLMDTNLTLVPSTEICVIVLALFAATTLFSGMFPAIRHASLKPISLFHSSTDSIGIKNKSLWVLTTIQFLLAVLFIQVMLIMGKQNNHLLDADVVGYNADNVLCMSGSHYGDLQKVKTELLRNPAIINVTWGSTVPQMNMSMTASWKDDKNQEQALNPTVEEDYLKTFDIKMIEGRFFSKQYPSDQDNSVVINRKVANILGYSDPIGKKMMLGGKQVTIIGLVGDFQAVPPIFSDLPQILRLSKSEDYFLLIKVDPRNRKTAHEYITKTLRKINPEYPVELKYHPDLLVENSKSYFSANYLIQLFFFLTIFTSLIGLFALSVFIAEKNRKDVCIRKICGASFRNVMPRLLKGILIQVGIAICVATPIAFLLGQKYLSMFPKHINMRMGLFLQGGLVALTITLLTVFWQAWRAANRNPVEALRYE
jgi:putative ABC transport system permease protein